MCSGRGSPRGKVWRFGRTSVPAYLAAACRREIRKFDRDSAPNLTQSSCTRLCRSWGRPGGGELWRWLHLASVAMEDLEGNPLDLDGWANNFDTAVESGTVGEGEA